MNKKGLHLVLVVLLTVSAVFCSYVLAQQAAKRNNSAASAVTVSQQPVTEREGERVLLVENNEYDYHFYTQGDKVIMTHNDKEYTFDGWGDNLRLDTPVIAIKDADYDGEDELFIQVSAAVKDNTVYHNVYALKRSVDENGEEKYNVDAFTAGTVNTLLDRMIKVELLQDPSCKKNGIFTLAKLTSEIRYDRETGLPESNKYVFRCLQDKNHEYLTINNWQKGFAECVLDSESDIYITIPTTVIYTNGETQNAGQIKFKGTIDDNFNMTVVAKSMSFLSNKEYALYGYTSDVQGWSSVINNSNKTVPRDKTIDYVELEASYLSEVETMDFSANNSDLNMLSSINASEGKIELVAKKGCSFSNEMLEQKQFSANLKISSKTADNNYDISYEASVYKNDSGNEVLKITFDKSYSQSLMNKLTVKFGVR